MTYGELKTSLELFDIPDGAQIALNIGFDADNISVGSSINDKHKSQYVEGWYKHLRTAPAVRHDDLFSKAAG